MKEYIYKIHPLAALFPELSSDEFKKLKADIELHGQLEPIVLSADSTTVLDGRHRLRALKELEQNPKTINFSEVQKAAQTSSNALVWKPQTEGDFIWSVNVLRRHLTDDQKAAIAHKWSDAVREAAKQRMKDGGKGLVNPPNPIHTREAIARKAGVSTHKVRQVETVAKHTPELLPKVESGEMKLKDAEKMAVATRPDSAAPKHQYAPQPSQPDYQITFTIQGARLASVEKIIRETFGDEVAADVEKIEDPSSRPARLSIAQTDFDKAKDEVEDIRDELQQWKDNLPDNLQGSQKAYELDEAIEQLEEMISGMNAIDFDVNLPGMF